MYAPTTVIHYEPGVRREWSWPRPAPLRIAGACLVGALLFATGLALLELGGVTGYVGAQVLFALAFLEHFAIQHECSQRSGWGHALVGHYASIFSFLPFYPWKCLHAEQDRDRINLAVPIPAAGIGSLPGFLAAWGRDARLRVWVPFFGVLRLVAVWTSPVERPAWMMTAAWDRARWACVASIVLLLSTCLGAHVLWPDLVQPLHFAPAFVLYLLLADAWVLWSVEQNVAKAASFGADW